MAIHTYMTDREHEQAAFDLVARCMFDRASEILSAGIPIHDHVKAVNTLSNTAVFKGLSNTTINVFYQLLETENDKNNDMKGWLKDD